MSESIKVAFIGCGKRGHASARGVSNEERCEVVALVDPSEEATTALADGFGFTGAKHFRDHRTMLDEVKPDFVVASLWTPLHLPVFRDCARAGVRAFQSEKPMAPTWPEAREMAAIAEETGCQLTFCHQRRFCPGNRKVRELLSAGVFGEILAMDLYSPCGLLDCGTHSIDQALSFNGESPARWVMGSLDLSEVKTHFNVPTEAVAAGIIVFENGVRSQIQCQGPDKDMGTGVRVHASNGLLEVDWNGRVRRGIRFDDPSWTFPAPDFDPKDPQSSNRLMAHQIADTLDALVAGREPELSHHKALRTTEIIFALYQSACTHRRIELPLHPEANAFQEAVAESTAG